MFICLNISKKNQLVTNDEFLESRARVVYSRVVITARSVF